MVLPPIVDSHVHFWDPFAIGGTSAEAARAFQSDPSLATRTFEETADAAHRAVVVTPEYLLQPQLPEDLSRDLLLDAGASLAAVIHVQSGRAWTDPVAETRWVDGLPFGQAGAPRLDGIVGLADPRAHNFADLLDRHAEASGRFCGVRAMTNWHPDPGVVSSQAEPGVLASPEFLRGFAHLVERDLTFDAWVYSQQLNEVSVLADEYPDARIVIDHLGTPVGALGPYGTGTGSTAAARKEIVRQWEDGMRALAAKPNTFAKMSGLAFPPLGLGPGWRNGVNDDLLALLAFVLTTFGPSRVLFGSNFPMDKPLATYASIVETVVAAAAAHGTDALRAVFAATAAAVYRTPTSAGAG